MKLVASISLLASVCVLAACQPKQDEAASETANSYKGSLQPLATEASDALIGIEFTDRKIIEDAEYFWAHTAGDVDGDGLADLVFINNNASGGILGYYKGQIEPGMWQKFTIAETPLSGGLFAGGDLEVADIDQDGDIDVVGIKHPGEWTDASASAEIFWYENLGSSDATTPLNNWKGHFIGEVPDAVKDVSFADFDKDGLLDVALLTFDSHTLSIFKHVSADNWERVQFIQNETLHEGMDIGDFNADGYQDIVANAYVFYNPKGELKNTWAQQNLDEKWNNQTGDWSRNGTKTFVADANQDGLDDIYLCHSERAGYPLVKYTPSIKNAERGELPIWSESEILPEITACHTLQVYDFNLDGALDVLTGINFARAVNIEATEFDVSLMLGAPALASYASTSDMPQAYSEAQALHQDGIYNGFAIDFEGDGDIDFFRYPNHESKELYLFVNQTK